MLQDCFDYVDWYIFRAASDDDICVYTDNQNLPELETKINADVCAALNARTSAFNSGNADEHKQASYALCKTIKTAKR